MKPALLLLFAAAAFAQVPAHSVVGPVTLDISDLAVPVAYGPAETKAVISVCTTQENTTDIHITVWQKLSATVTEGYDYYPTVVQVGAGFCASMTAITASAKVTGIDVQASNTTHFVSPAPATDPAPAVQRRK